jgi:hypothetical protein
MGHVSALHCGASGLALCWGKCPRYTLGHVFALYCGSSVRALLWLNQADVDFVATLCELLWGKCLRSSVGQVFAIYCRQVYAVYSGANVRAQLCGK